MEEPLILINNENPGVTILTMNRPEKRNALNIPFMEEFCKIIDDCKRNPDLRVIIINGKGPVFCTGLDPKDVMDPSTSFRSSELIGKCLIELYSSPFITIAAVQGAAVAGGAGMVTACDFAIAAEGTKFGYPEVRRGLVAAQVMTFLIRQMGQKDIRELLLLGELFDAERALSLGLINRIVPPDQLMQEALKYAQLFMKGAPGALEQTKKLIDEFYPTSFLDDLKKGLECHRSVRETFEAKEGAAAFLEHRPPSWDMQSVKK